MLKTLFVLLYLVLIAVVTNPDDAESQTSGSYQLEEFTFNNGGHPAEGTSLSSPNFTMTLDAIGDAVVSSTLSSPAHALGAGFVPPYPPPGEVMNLVFSTGSNLEWDIQPSVGHYNVYRGEISSLPGGYGTCQATGITAELYTDAATPPAGQCYFYLITASNLLYEEGSKGYDSGNLERSNLTPCN